MNGTAGDVLKFLEALRMGGGGIVGAETAAAMRADAIAGIETTRPGLGWGLGFAVLRDPIACKPAVMAETDQYVAFGSEYRALANLPGIEDARVWEPEPSTVYFWEH